jgi:tetratricopeptide (TPR) repeat protein
MVCSLALALFLQPDPAALLPLYRQALAAREKQFGAAHVKTARAASDLGLYLKKLGLRAEALGLLRRALEIDEKAHGFRHPLVAEDLENIASLVEPREAVPLLARASECRDPGTAARALGKLAIAHERLGNREAAIAARRRAADLEEAASGPQHPRLAARWNALALALEPAAAEPLLRRALAIQAEALGRDHPETAVTRNNLANVLLALGRLADAERMQREALAALEDKLGPEHPRVAVSCSNLADILRAKGDIAGAEALYRRALAIDEAAYGPDHAEVAADRENLAALLESSGRAAEARRLRRGRPAR